MAFRWRKWVRAVHRDMGYLFFALTVVYALSGIAVNHIKEWNPSYVITNRTYRLTLPEQDGALEKDQVLTLLEAAGEKGSYKKHYYPSYSELKVFIDGGSMVVDLTTGEAWVEKIQRRPVFHTVNFLHYNPGKWWTTLSDIFAIALIVIALTGLFILKGSKGITARGAWLTAAGILVPLLFLYLFY